MGDAMVTNLFEVRSCGLQLFGKSLPRRDWFRQLWFICASRFGMMLVHGETAKRALRRSTSWRSLALSLSWGSG